MLLALIAAVAPGAHAATEAANAATPQGLRADYYRMTSKSSLDFATYTGTAVDTSLNVADLLPRMTEMAGTTNAVAIRWTGTIEIPATGAYTFYIKGDNGFRMSIDGTTVIDHWTTDWDVQTQSAPVTLEAGTHELAYDYNQGDGGAYITTEWSGPGITRTRIPDAALHQPAGFSLRSDAKVTVDASGTKATVTFPAALTAVPADAGKHLAVVSGGVVWNTVSRAAGDDRSSSADSLTK